MRNYIKFWYQQVDFFRTVDQGTAKGFVSAEIEEDLEERMEWYVGYVNESTAGNPYDEVTVLDPQVFFMEMNKEAVMNLLQWFDVNSPFDRGANYQERRSDGSLPFLEFVVEESPRPTWSHGH